ELREDVLQVAGDRVLADDELLGDLAIRLPRGDVAQHLELARTEAVSVVGRSSVEPHEIGRGGKPFEDLAGRAKLQLSALLVAEPAARLADEHPDTRDLVRRVELLPDAARVTERLERGLGVPLGELDPTARAGRERLEHRT